MTKLHVNLGDNSYDVIVGQNILPKAKDYFDLNRRVLIVTDSGVPQEYAKAIAENCKNSKIITIHSGESSKSIDGLKTLLSAMVQFDMDRKDCVIGVGGGVVGDLTGFAAACYMRGIDFYNVPTTLLSQVDSSIGGKTAIDYDGVKNIVGAFHQPKGVLVDVNTLKSLPTRQISNGLAEAIKMSLTSNKSLFEKFENWSKDDILENIEEIIVASLKIKKEVVEKDEKEAGLRKILNFGHTFGHGVEAEEEMRGIFHGECVAIGMLAMCEESVRARLIPVLKKVGLPTEYNGNVDSALKFIIHDKKCANGTVSAVFVREVGSFEITTLSTEQFAKMVKSVF